MWIFKIVKGQYENSDAVENVIQYVFRNGNINKNLIGGRNVFFCLDNYIENIIQQFLTVKKYYCQNDKRQLYHFVLSYHEKENIPLEKAWSIGQRVADYFGTEYQVVFAVHTDTDCLHIHFVVNSVSFVTGRKYDYNKAEDYRIKRLIIELKR